MAENESLTVESALAELMRMFPDEEVVEVRADSHARYFADYPGDEVSSYSYGLVSVGERQFRSTTLTEAMQQVREWAAKEVKDE